MFFLFLNNADIKFAKLRKFILWSYITVEIFFITSQIEFIDKRDFIKAAMDKNFRIDVVYIAVLRTMLIHPSKAFQVKNNPILAAL